MDKPHKIALIVEKIFIAIFILFVPLPIFLFINGEIPSWRTIKFNRALDEKISTGQFKIPLSELTDFYWDRVCFLGTYRYDDTDFNAKLKVPYDLDRESAHGDGLIEVVFLDDKNQKSYALWSYNIYGGIFDPPEYDICLEREEAVYTSLHKGKRRR